MRCHATRLAGVYRRSLRRSCVESGTVVVLGTCRWVTLRMIPNRTKRVFVQAFRTRIHRLYESTSISQYTSTLGPNKPKRSPMWFALWPWQPRFEYLERTGVKMSNVSQRSYPSQRFCDTPEFYHAPSDKRGPSLYAACAIVTRCFVNATLARHAAKSPQYKGRPIVSRALPMQYERVNCVLKISSFIA